MEAQALLCLQESTEVRVLACHMGGEVCFIAKEART